MDRPKVGMHHEYKKGYKVAFQNAMFVWNISKKEELENLMKKDSVSEEQIEAEQYYNSAIYKGCVDRSMPPPSLLYWRVRSVFVMYGDLVDKNGKPLFNKDAWASANNFPKKILRGYYSDPPGE